jgi:hypothetical protein
MSYRCSRARRAFESQLDQALQELTPLYKFARKSGGLGAARLLAAYYVFAFAQLEVFIKSYVEDLLNTISASGPAFDKWPDLMLAYLLHRGANLGADYRKFSIGEDEGAILARVAETARKIAAWGDGGPVPAEIDAAIFLERKKYPSPKNLPQLFKRLGVKQLWPIISAAGKMNSELILTSLNDLRTGIAHEGKLPPDFSFADFRSRLEQMERFVAALDRGVSAHFCPTIISRSSWNRLMA